MRSLQLSYGLQRVRQLACQRIDDPILGRLLDIFGYGLAVAEERKRLLRARRLGKDGSGGSCLIHAGKDQFAGVKLVKVVSSMRVKISLPGLNSSKRSIALRRPARSMEAVKTK